MAKSRLPTTVERSQLARIASPASGGSRPGSGPPCQPAIPKAASHNGRSIRPVAYMNRNSERSPTTISFTVFGR